MSFAVPTRERVIADDRRHHNAAVGDPLTILKAHTETSKGLIESVEVSR